MGGLNTSLTIGLQALEASQAALEATSNNIANANTPGYTREVPELSENLQDESYNSVSGGGVTLDGLQSVRDEIVNLQIQQQTSLQSSADAQSSSLQDIQTYFTSSSGSDIASELTAFGSSLTTLSANASSSSVQAAVLSAGTNLAQAFNTTSKGLVSAQNAADAQVSQTVTQINTLTQQIAGLNQQLAQSTTPGQDGGTVQDQRDQDVQQLSALTGISITQSSDGETLTTGDGTPLVVGGKSYALSTETGTNGFQHVVDSNGTDVTSSIQGGTLGGAIKVRDTTISGYLTQLNTLASQLSTAVNSAQAEGYDSNGNAGTAFFTVPSSPEGAAASISVALTDPSQVAVSSDGSAGSNGNVANLSAALTTALPSGQTAASAYATLVYNVGNDESTASAHSTAIGLSLQQLTDQQGAVAGVSTDEESTNLIRYQTAYEAAARIVSTIAQLNTVTLDMGDSGGY